MKEPLSDSLKGLRGLASLVSDVEADIRPSFSSTSATSGRLDPVAHGGPHLNANPDGAGGRQGARTAPGATVVEWGGSGDKREHPLKARLSRYLWRVLLGLLAFMALALYLAQKEASRVEPVGSDYPVPPLVRHEAATPPTENAPAPPEPAKEASPPPAPQREALEVKPPVQSGQVLTPEQIRYCLAETIRIEAIDRLLDRTSEASVELFNTALRDWNSRCGSFRYLEGDLAAARAEVEPRRSILETAGRQRYLAWQGGTRAQPREPRAPTVAEPPGQQPSPGKTPPPDGGTRSGMQQGVVDGASQSTQSAVQRAMDGFATDIGMLARARLTYPRDAVRRGEQGAVAISVAIGSAGELKEVSVHRSSGYLALDEAARNAVLRVGTFPVIPAPLAGRAFSVTIPFRFTLM